MAETLFYRAVSHSPPVPRDFLSDLEAGLPLAPWEKEEDRLGRSVFDVERKARDLAKWLARHTEQKWYVAAIPLAASGPFRVEQRGADRHHFTLWGDTEEIAKKASIVWPKAPQASATIDPWRT